ncbi:MAG: hypothetical protein HY362_02840 [Candidatus Aenigmarchaeota archaeon]|nr:hypothetical protein [Candidatus Aenigmarchaeota archaeon]
MHAKTTGDWEIAFVAVLFLLIYVFFPLLSTVAYVTQQTEPVTSNASIQSLAVGRFTDLNITPSPRANSSINVTATVQNTGNLGDLLFINLTMNNTLGVFQNTSCSLTVASNSLKNCSVNFIPNTTGLYQITTQIYNGTRSVLWDSNITNFTANSPVYDVFVEVIDKSPVSFGSVSANITVSSFSSGTVDTTVNYSLTTELGQYVVALSNGQTYTRIVKFTAPPTPGSYRLSATAHSADYYVTAFDTFTVVASPESGGSKGVGGAGGGAAVTETTTTLQPTQPKLNITKYQDEVRVSAGDFIFTTVSISSFYNSSSPLLLYLDIEGLNKSWFEVKPVSMILKPGQEQAFSVLFKPPKEAGVKNYPFAYKASAGGTEVRTLGIFTITPAVYRGLDINRIETPVLITGIIGGKVRILVKNTQNSTVNITVLLKPQQGITVLTKPITLTLAAGEEREVEIEIASSENGILPTSLQITIQNESGTETIEKRVDIVSQPIEELPALPVIIVIGVAVAFVSVVVYREFFIIVIKRRKNKR